MLCIIISRIGTPLLLVYVVECPHPGAQFFPINRVISFCVRVAIFFASGGAASHVRTQRFSIFPVVLSSLSEQLLSIRATVFSVVPDQSCAIRSVIFSLTFNYVRSNPRVIDAPPSTPVFPRLFDIHIRHALFQRLPNCVHLAFADGRFVMKIGQIIGHVGLPGRARHDGHAAAGQLIGQDLLHHLPLHQHHRCRGCLPRGRAGRQGRRAVQEQ